MEDFKTKFQCLKNKVADKVNKSKALITTGVLLGTASIANAAIDVDQATGTVSGELELAPFFSGAKVILVALASIIVIRWVMNLIRRG